MNMNITRAPRLHMVVIYLLVWLELENVKQVLQEGHSFIFLSLSMLLLKCLLPELTNYIAKFFCY